ncbi:MAG TPA: alpha-L-fucosidase [Candidatus Cybelea sp.]|nr:alpha-L-fucosidase [Candidatus Cybelea sp.]
MKIHFRLKSQVFVTAILFLALAGAPSARAQTAQDNYTPTPENLKARTWFQDAKFGMFIHWGVYSVLGDGEWIMETRPINRTDYAKVPAFFNPIKFDPAAWVALAKAAGMKYITITSKHHDGFAMFDSRLTDWNVVARTPYGKDVIGMLAAECHKQGIKLFLYHSQLDWHSADYFPRGRTGHRTGRAESGNWDAYLNFMDGQLRELLTNYGEIGGIWFDGMWDKPDADWHLARTYALIHELQPQALVGSNHHKNPFPGEDFQMFEKDLPGQHTTGFNPDQSVSTLPLETAETMNNSWGFNLTDEHYKNSGDLIRYLLRAAGANANFLLNVGPMPNGVIQPEFVQRLTEVGQWMKQYGESIYGTRGGPLASGAWGVTTQRGSTVYVHVLDWNQPVLALAGMPRPVHLARLLRDGSSVEFTPVKGGLVLKIPEPQPEEVDRVIVLELEAPK